MEQANARVISKFCGEREWIRNLAEDPATASNTSVCLTLDLEKDQVCRVPLPLHSVCRCFSRKGVVPCCRYRRGGWGMTQGPRYNTAIAGQGRRPPKPQSWRRQM